jgi:hypothetical protein
VTQQDRRPLAHEEDLLKLIFAEEIDLGTARVESVGRAKLPDIVASHARKSQVRSIVVSTGSDPVLPESDDAARLILSAAQPILWDGGHWHSLAESGTSAWREALHGLLLRTL